MNSNLLFRYELLMTPRSPFARRIRLALERLGLPYTRTEVNPFEPTLSFLNYNPLGLVPVLIEYARGGNAAHIENGVEPFTPYVDSVAQLELLHDRTQKIWSTDITQRAEERRISALIVGVMTASVAFFLEQQRNKTGVKGAEPDWLQDHETVILNTLSELEKTFFDLNLQAHSQAGLDLGVALEYVSLRLPHLQVVEKSKAFQLWLKKCKEWPAFVESAPPPA